MRVQSVKIILLSAVLCSAFLSCSKRADSASSDKRGAFTVLSFSPSGELPQGAEFPSIQIQFSQPVVALSELGTPSDKSPYASIEPQLSGTWRWYGTSLLSFDSSDKAIPQKLYTVNVKKDLTSVSGEKISGTVKFSFHTAELQMTTVIPGYAKVKSGVYVDSDDVPMDSAQDIAVYFSDKVNAKHIAKSLTVTAGTDASPLPYTFSQDEDTMMRLKLSEIPARDTDIVITLPAGSSSDKDCFATTKTQSLSFHTLQPLTVASSDSDSGSYGKYSNPVRIIFNHPVASLSAEKLASLITTDPPSAVTGNNVELKGARLIVYGLPFPFKSSYTLAIAEGLSDEYGQKLSGGYSLKVEVPEAGSFASYKDSGFHMLEAQFEPHLVFERQNVLDGSSYSLLPIRGITDAYNTELLTKAQTNISVNKDKKDSRIIEAVDLRPYLEKTSAGYRGTVIFSAAMKTREKYIDWKTKKPSYRDCSRDNLQCIQVTDLGLTVRYGFNKALILVSKISTGEPVSGAEVSSLFVPQGRHNSWNRDAADYAAVFTDGIRSHTAVTGNDGLAVITFSDGELFSRNSLKSALYFEARTDSDSAVFEPSQWSNCVYNDEWVNGSPLTADKGRSVTFMFTDRGLYKPGETVTFRGIDRTLDKGAYTPYAGGYHISFTESSWKPHTYGTITGSASASGTFWGSWKIPADIAPGTYEIRYWRDADWKNDGTGDYESCTVQVQFFERLRFEASASIPKLVYISGDTIGADVKAQYLGGGSLAGSTCHSFWTREPSGFAPSDPSYSSWRFGPLQGYDGRSPLGTSDGALSGDGRAHIDQKTGGEKLKGMAYVYRAEAQITDSGNQMIAASASAVVHPAQFYIGISPVKNVKGFPKKGDTLTYDITCITPEGKPASEKMFAKHSGLTIELLREDWKEVQQIGYNGEINTRYERDMKSENRRTVSLGSAKEISVKPENGGAYLIRLSSQDSRGRDVVTETRFYATSSDFTWFNRDDDSEITMTADKTMYRSGDTAHILAQSALPKGRYLMTIEREGIISEKVITLGQASTVIDVPVKEEYLPVVYITLSSYSVRTGAPRNDYSTPDIDKPKGYFGYTAISVDTSPRKFDIAVRSGKTVYRPGEKAQIKLHASKNGVPLSGAEITLMAVDRGVIDLINYHVADPASFFYSSSRFPDCIRGDDSRSILIDPVTYEVRNLFGGDAAEDSAEGKIKERKNFEPTALFIPSLVTDSSGDVSATFTLPDSLTSYRITAVGVDKNDFSLAESELPVTNPVSVREVLPAEVRIGDRSEAGAVITNMTDTDKKVTVSIGFTSGLEKTGYVPSDDDIVRLPGSASADGETEKTVTVHAGRTESVMFAFRAESEGWITASYTVTGDDIREKIIKPLEIERPYIYETVTTAGEVRGDGTSSVKEKIAVPSSSDGGRGTFSVQLDSSRLCILKSAVDYVFRYPYGCMEQRSSAVLPLVAFGNYMKIFGLESEVKNPLSASSKEIRSWAKYQLSDGGFPYWSDGTYSDLGVSLRIGEILALAREKGIGLKDGPDTAKLVSYIEKNLALLRNSGNSGDAQLYPLSYGCYVLQRLGASPADRDIDFILDSGNADIPETAFCGLTYLAKGNPAKAQQAIQKIKQHMSLTTQGCTITPVKRDLFRWQYLGGRSEQYALSLMLFTEFDRTDTYNGHILYELLQQMKASGGYWTSTASTARVLAAVDVYIRENGLESTGFTAQALLDGRTFLSSSFKGAAAESAVKTEPFTGDFIGTLPRGKEVPLEFIKKGKGVLYYTASMKYAVPSSAQFPRDNGICVYTEIRDTATGEIVTGSALKAGTIYRETVYITTTKDRTFLAVRAPVPAGAEIMNAAFVTTGTVPPSAEDETSGSDDDSPHYEEMMWTPAHEDIYDSEVRYFWNEFGKGNQRVEFLFRAVRGGTYMTPSATAECMYESEISGRSAGKAWTIE
jgi:uncharacterized protein YfaS (alpha-2-macroglobulin family)